MLQIKERSSCAEAQGSVRGNVVAVQCSGALRAGAMMLQGGEHRTDHTWVFSSRGSH